MNSTIDISELYDHLCEDDKLELIEKLKNDNDLNSHTKILSFNISKLSDIEMIDMFNRIYKYMHITDFSNSGAYHTKLYERLKNNYPPA